MLSFSKYHGLGNDFIVVDLRAGIDARAMEKVQSPDIVRAICDRQFGVGGDGVLAILPSTTGDARMRVLNADGSEAEMCGNGLRCVVKYLYDRGGVAKERIAVETGAGVLACTVALRGGVVDTVTIDMGAPRLLRGEIPMTGPAGERAIEATVDGVAMKFSGVSMGNPHAISFVGESGSDLLALAKNVGPGVETHGAFPRRTNVEFVRVHAPRELELVVWERGCGITLACGTGACATAVAACLTGRSPIGEEITVTLLGGPLAITVAADYQTVFMRGPAAHVFDGTLALDGAWIAARPPSR